MPAILSIVYTPLHGVGETSVARALETAGFRRVHILASQRTPDGDFPNVPDHVANPEYPRTLEAAIAEAKAAGADLVIASDPDADRIGVAVPVSARPPGRLDHPGRQPDRHLALGLRDQGMRGAGEAPIRSLSGHDARVEPDGPRPGRARGNSHRG